MKVACMPSRSNMVSVEVIVVLFIVSDKPGWRTIASVNVSRQVSKDKCIAPAAVMMCDRWIDG